MSLPIHPELVFPAPSQKVLRYLAKYRMVTIRGVPNCKSAILDYLKTLFHVIPQYNNQLIWEVTPIKSGVGSSIGDGAIGMHTEMTEFLDPPAYCALHCVRPASKGGALELVDCTDFIHSLPKSTLKRLMTTHFEFKWDNEIAPLPKDHMNFWAPILSRSPRSFVIRYDEAMISMHPHNLLNCFSEWLVEYKETRTRFIHQKKNQLIIWNNQTVLHSRDAFVEAERMLWRFCLNPKLR